MKVIVLGSGVIGVTSAWYLAEAGHEVIVLDRQPGPALETSFANAGEISPGYASPWAAPGIPLKALKWLFMRHSPLYIRPAPSLSMLRFAIAMLRNCTAAAYEVNKSRMVPLAEYSRDMLRALRAETGITYDERSMGTLQLFRSDKLLAGAAKDIAVLRELGVAHELLDVEGCIRAEPALARVREKFVGGLRLPEDETGDCFKFTEALRDLAAARGVDFRYRRHDQPACSPTATSLAGVIDRPWPGFGRRLRPCPRQSLAAPAEAARHRIAGLSCERLFAHRPGHRAFGRAPVDSDGREIQGGYHPTR